MDQIGPDQTRWDQIGPDRTRSDQIQIGSDDLGALRSTLDTFTAFSVQV